MRSTPTRTIEQQAENNRGLEELDKLLEEFDLADDEADAVRDLAGDLEQQAREEIDDLAAKHGFVTGGDPSGPGKSYDWVREQVRDRVGEGSAETIDELAEKHGFTTEED